MAQILNEFFKNDERHDRLFDLSHEIGSALADAANANTDCTYDVGMAIETATAMELLAREYGIAFKDTNFLSLGCGEIVGYDRAVHDTKRANILVPAVVGFRQKQLEGLGKAIGVDYSELDEGLPETSRIAQWQLQQYTHMAQDLIKVVYEPEVKRDFLVRLGENVGINDIEGLAGSFGMIHANEFIYEPDQDGSMSIILSIELKFYGEMHPDFKVSDKSFTDEMKSLVEFLLQENGLFVMNDWVYQKRKGILVKVEGGEKFAYR